MPGFAPAYMLDQSHNVTDPLESLMTSAVELVRAYVQAHLVDREALADARTGNDALMALQTLKQAFTTDVSPILAMARAACRRRHRSGRRVSRQRLPPAKRRRSARP